MGEDHAGSAGTKPLTSAFSPRVIRQSMIMAAVVGTLLNCVNQGEAVLGCVGVDVPKLLVTYATPFLVSTYGAWNMARSMK